MNKLEIAMPQLLEVKPDQTIPYMVSSNQTKIDMFARVLHMVLRVMEEESKINVDRYAAVHLHT